MGYGPGPRFNSDPYGACLTPGGGAGDLKLTAEQMQKVLALREDHWKKIAPLQNELMNKGLELLSLWSQPNPDQERILAGQKEINALREKIPNETTKHYLEMRQILTSEQQARLGTNFGAGLGQKGGFGANRGMGYSPCFW